MEEVEDSRSQECWQNSVDMVLMLGIYCIHTVYDDDSIQYDLIVVLQMEPDLQVLRLHFDFNYWNVV